MWKTIALIPLVFGIGSIAAADDLSTDEQAVWDLELAYWEYRKNNDPAAYRSLYALDFLGWPKRMKVALDRLTVDPDSFGSWIPAAHQNPKEIYDYEISDSAVRAFGDVVMTHYFAVDFFRSKETGEILRERGRMRYTHTWQRRGETWQIIGGMSADPLPE